MFTYDLSTTRGKVRLLIPDATASGYVFEDEEIDAFLALDTDVRRSAALAIETIASSQALTLKVIRILDLQADGAAVSRELRARAKDLRQQALDAETSEDGGAFDVVEMVPNAFAQRDRVWNEMLRER